MFLNKLNTLPLLITVPEYSIVPAMNSNTAPAPFIASASTEYYDSADPPVREAWIAFNKKHSIPNASNNNDSWITDVNVFVGGIGNEWLQIKLDKRRILTRYVLRERGLYHVSYTSMPKNWSINGSNNGIDWNIIQEYSDTYTVQANYFPHSYNINNTVPYLYYRLHITEIFGASYNIVYGYLPIGEWELYSTYR
jgi:hypothetical protein